jgi:glycoprotein-N-acetylgalactosamine 3-beta-galactosyltransferase
MHDKNKCRIEDDGPEDLELGKCFENQTIFVDERDEKKEKRFFPVGIMEHFGTKDSNSSYWYDDMMYYESKYGGIDCCSQTVVNLHYVPPKEMYILDYLIYNVHTFGLKKNSTKLPIQKISLEDVIKASDINSSAADFQRSHAIYHDLDKDEIYKKR